MATLEITKRVTPSNTRVEQHFYQRNQLLVDLDRVRQELIDTEYRIALECCPFYLGQRLWYEHHFERIRVYVCCIDFQSEPPFYEFFVRAEKPVGIAAPKKMKVKLAQVAGIKNAFVEPLEQYEARLKDLVERKLVRLKPQHCSFDTPYIISRSMISHRSDALAELGKARSDWFDRVFSLRNTKEG
jgi:hypothetical protein